MSDDATPSIRELVETFADELVAMKNHGQLHSWARKHGICTASAFFEYKLALRWIGVDYDAVRERWKAANERVQRGEIAKLVREHADTLKRMSRGQLYGWARANDIDSSVEFWAFKEALMAIGIDYAALKRRDVVSMGEGGAMQES